MDLTSTNHTHTSHKTLKTVKKKCEGGRDMMEEAPTPIH